MLTSLEYRNHLDILEYLRVSVVVRFSLGLFVDRDFQLFRPSELIEQVVHIPYPRYCLQD